MQDDAVIQSINRNKKKKKGVTKKGNKKEVAAVPLPAEPPAPQPLPTLDVQVDLAIDSVQFGTTCDVCRRGTLKFFRINKGRVCFECVDLAAHFVFHTKGKKGAGK